MAKKKKPGKMPKGAAVRVAKMLGLAKEKTVDPSAGRTRVLFVEPPQRKKGNPFVAVRVPVELHEEFTRLAKKNKTTPAVMLRDYMYQATGMAELGDEVES